MATESHFTESGQSPGFKAEEFVTKAQLQSWLGITPNQRLGFHDAGLPYIKIGNTTLYHLPAVCDWLKAHETRRQS